MNNTEKKQNNKKIIIEAFTKYIEEVDDGKKLYQLRKYIERFNNTDEFSQYIVMTDMFDTFKVKVREGEKDTQERKCAREAGHEFDKWKETECTKTRYDSSIGRERSWKDKIWTRTCTKCGFIDSQTYMPLEVKKEREEQAKILVKKKEELQKLQKEIEDLENNK